jgi:hypothetical protein
MNGLGMSHTRTFTVGAVAFFVLLVTLADDFKTIGGKEFRNATVSRVEPDGIVLRSKSGIAKVYLVELPKDVQERFGYDSAAFQKREESGAQTIRCTTWNLEWFPNGRAKEAPAAQQDQRIKEAADVLANLASRIIATSKTACHNCEPEKGVRNQRQKQLSSHLPLLPIQASRRPKSSDRAAATSPCPLRVLP